MIRHVSTIAMIFLVFGTMCFGQVLNIRVDVSKSVQSDFRTSALDNLKEQLPEILKTKVVKKVNLMTFAGIPDGSGAVRFTIPELEVLDCGRPKIPKEFERIKSVAEPIKQRFDLECTALRKEAAEKYEYELEGTLNAIRLAVDKIKPQESSCTALIDILTMMAMSSRREPIYELLVTDGAESCNALGAVPPPSTSSNMQAILLYTPSAREWEANHSLQVSLERAKRRLRSIGSWVKVVPFFSDNITADFVTEPMDGRFD